MCRGVVPSPMAATQDTIAILHFQFNAISSIVSQARDMPAFSMTQFISLAMDCGTTPAVDDAPMSSAAAANWSLCSSAAMCSSVRPKWSLAAAGTPPPRTRSTPRLTSPLRMATKNSESVVGRTTLALHSSAGITQEHGRTPFTSDWQSQQPRELEKTITEHTFDTHNIRQRTTTATTDLIAGGTTQWFACQDCPP